MDIASTWDKAKNGVRNGGAGRPRVARSDQHAESDRHHLDPTFDQVEGNSEKMQRGCAEKGLEPIESRELSSAVTIAALVDPQGSRAGHQRMGGGRGLRGQEKSRKPGEEEPWDVVRAAA